MGKNYTIVETSKLAAVRGGGHIYSLIADEDIENGSVGYVGELSEDVEGLETHEFKTFSTDTLGTAKAVLVASTEWNYDDCSKANQLLSNYINEAGIAFRAYDLAYGDEFMISETGFSATTMPAKGQYVTLNAGSTKFALSDSEPADAYFVGKIIGTAKRGYGWTTKDNKAYGSYRLMYLVKVLKNEVK